MAFRVYKDGNYLIVHDGTDVIHSKFAKNVMIEPDGENTSLFRFFYITNYRESTERLEFFFSLVSDLTDNEAPPVTFTKTTFVEFYVKETGLGEPLDYHVELAKGNILGDEPFNLNIASTQIGSSAFTDIWSEAASLIYETSATTWEVLSSDAADAVAGTGASKVKITTLDGSFNLQSQEVTLTGVTPVALTGTHLRPHDMEVVAPVGTDLSNKGKITLRAVVSVNIQDSIIAGISRSFSTHFTVPVGKKALLERASILVGKGDDVIIQLVSFDERINEPHIVQSFARVYQSGQELLQTTPATIPEKTSVRLQGQSSNASISVTIALQFIITDL